MIRIFLHYVLPILLPTVLYLGWLAFARRRARVAGGKVPGFDEGPWFWTILLGLVLMFGGLVTWGLFGGDAPGSVYQPPRYENGKVSPGRFR